MHNVYDMCFILNCSCVSPVTSDVGCPPSFARYRGRCYRAVPALLSFASSYPGHRDICPRMKWGETSYLARVDSLEVLNFIKTITV